jgi:tetratricopeptide (TPR) repeat protein
MRWIVFCASLALMLAPMSACAEDALDEARRAYAAARFDEAARALESVLAEEGASVDVLVDLGTARLTEGKLALAIVAFERARRLAPHDAGALEGLERARAEAGVETPVETPLEQAASLWPAQAWLRAGLVGTLAFCALALLAGVLPRARTLATIVGVPSALTVAASAAALWVGTVGVDRAVVLEAELAGHVAPTEASEVLFALRSGELVRVEQAYGDHVRVRRGSGARAWVLRRGVEPIVPGALPR